MKAKTFRVISFTVSAVILAVVLVLNIAVGIFSEQINEWVIGYNTNGDTSTARASGAALVEQIQREGTVLVQNNSNTEGEAPVLPLDKNAVKKVNVFGWASVDWVYSGSGSGRVKGTRDSGDESQARLYDLYDALDGYGIEYNTALREMYTKYKARRDHADPFDSVSNTQSSGLGTLHSFNYEYSMLYEPSVTDERYYSQELKTNAEGYSDTALVVLGRVSGESNDSPKVQYKYNAGTDNTRTYLEISTEEEALLKYVGEKFKNVVVLINSTSVIELGFLETIPGLDACLIVATTGTSGALAIPKLLYGEYTPSGRTADTFAYDLSTNPTYVNTGSGVKGDKGGEDTTNFYPNGSGLYPTTVKHTNGSKDVSYSGVAYTDYAESIYVGYKWYETADAEGFWNSEKAKTQWGIQNGYEDVVQYPFGYGLSYTTFEWEVRNVSLENNSVITPDSTIKFEVAVTNTGNAAGQDVVELYYTAPYTSGGIEKSSVNLIGFAKTQQVLQPGDSELVTLEVKASDMKSYDCYDANSSGNTGYEMEAGEYVLSLRENAHTLATEKIVKGQASYTYRVEYQTDLYEDDVTGNAVVNRFTKTGNKDLTDGVAIDGNSDHTAEITYLSRKDFAGTFPYEQKASREMVQAIKDLNLYTSSMADAWADPDDQDITTGADGVLVYDATAKKLTDLGRQLGNEEFFDNDAMWSPVLDALDLAEMKALVLHGYANTAALNGVGKPKTQDLDGPNQIGSFKNEVKAATGFSSIVLAQTWNEQLAYSMGLAVATDAAALGINGWYGPAMNLHRSPFGGRNYEYYSEDAYLSGIMAANAVKAAKNGGVFSYLKHLCLYESESNRDGMYNWITEQALREAYIKPFEICVKEGGATGIMTSYGRIGAVWTGGSEALLTEVVRGEWGFKGAIITDYADNHVFMNGDQMLRAGGDLWMDGVLNNGAFTCETTSNSYKQALRRANKNVLYMYLNALATQAQYNEDIENHVITDGVPIHTADRTLKFRWYIPVLVAVDVLAVAGCGVWIFFAIRKKDPAPDGQGGSEPTDSDGPAENE